MPPPQKKATRKATLFTIMHDSLLRELNRITKSYFITVTLKPRLYNQCAADQYGMTIYDLEDRIRQTCTEYCVIPELTEQGNVHYHGWVVPKNDNIIPLIDLLKKSYKLGFHKVTREPIITYESKQRTIAYMVKDVIDTAPLLKIPITTLQLLESSSRIARIRQDNEDRIKQLQRENDIKLASFFGVTLEEYLESRTRELNYNEKNL